MATVWVVEGTDYDDYGNYGVYSSLAVAMESHPAADWTQVNTRPPDERWGSRQLMKSITAQPLIESPNPDADEP